MITHDNLVPIKLKVFNDDNQREIIVMVELSNISNIIDALQDTATIEVSECGFTICNYTEGLFTLIKDKEKFIISKYEFINKLLRAEYATMHKNDKLSDNEFTITVIDTIGPIPVYIKLSSDQCIEIINYDNELNDIYELAYGDNTIILNKSAGTVILDTAKYEFKFNYCKFISEVCKHIHYTTNSLKTDVIFELKKDSKLPLKLSETDLLNIQKICKGELNEYSNGNIKFSTHDTKVINGIGCTVDGIKYFSNIPTYKILDTVNAALEKIKEEKSKEFYYVVFDKKCMRVPLYLSLNLHEVLRLRYALIKRKPAHYSSDNGKYIIDYDVIFEEVTFKFNDFTFNVNAKTVLEALSNKPLKLMEEMYELNIVNKDGIVDNIVKATKSTIDGLSNMLNHRGNYDFLFMNDGNVAIAYSSVNNSIRHNKYGICIPNGNNLIKEAIDDFKGISCYEVYDKEIMDLPVYLSLYADDVAELKNKLSNFDSFDKYITTIDNIEYKFVNDNNSKSQIIIIIDNKIFHAPVRKLLESFNNPIKSKPTNCLSLFGYNLGGFTYRTMLCLCRFIESNLDNDYIKFTFMKNSNITIEPIVGIKNVAENSVDIERNDGRIKISVSNANKKLYGLLKYSLAAYGNEEEHVYTLMCPRCFNLYDKCECDYVGKMIKVDEKLAEPISRFNKYGMNTLYSCQGDSEKPNIPYLMFSASMVKNNNELEKFINALPESWKYLEIESTSLAMPSIYIEGNLKCETYLEDINEFSKECEYYIEKHNYINN